MSEERLARAQKTFVKVYHKSQTNLHRYLWPPRFH